MAMGQRASVVEGDRDLFAPRIYYFHPLLAGPRTSWPLHLQRCRAMGFEYVLTAPLFAPGAAGDLFLTADHEKPHPAIEQSLNADQLYCRVGGKLPRCRTELLLRPCPRPRRERCERDAVASRTGSLTTTQSGHAVDPRSVCRRLPRRICASPIHSADGATAWWIERLLRLANAGASGFCLSQPHLVPRDAWRHIIDSVRRSFPRLRFVAWTPGAALARDRDAARGGFRWRVLVRAVVGRPR